VIVAQVRRSVRERGLLAPGERVLVACSGGPDSAVLLHTLSRLAPELSLELRAASVDHRLRAGSERAVQTARGLAERLEVPFRGLAVDVTSEGPSLQAKARAARYAALLAEAARCGASAIAVGHTRDDQAETVIARVLRGSGLLALRGIEPRREDGVTRPLLDCARADVHAHAARFGLPFVHDPANADPAHERARIRSTVIPVLAAEDPRLIEHLARLADEARDASALVAGAARGSTARALRDLPRLVRDELVLARVRERTGRTIRRVHLDAIDRALAEGGEVLLGGGWVARVDPIGALRLSHEPARRTRSADPDTDTE
jgi:tRNA(Ile)-lysidine synthase